MFEAFCGAFVALVAYHESAALQLGRWLRYVVAFLFGLVVLIVLKWLVDFLAARWPW